MDVELRNHIHALTSLIGHHRALATLRLLDRIPGRRSNEHVIYDWLAKIGLACTHSELQLMLEWLNEKNLVKADTVDGLLVVDLSSRGLEVATGVTRMEGVLRPDPECSY